MKILFVGPPVHDHSQIKTFGAMWSYYLSRALEAAGATIVRDGYFGSNTDAEKVIKWWETADLSGYDHVVAISRYFSKVPPQCGLSAMRRVKGEVVHVHDCPTNAPVTATLSICQPFGAYANRAKFIGWAADAELFQPAQKPKELGILIDHPLYANRVDDTAAIIEDVVRFARSDLWASFGWDAVRVRRIVDGGFVTVESKLDSIPTFNRKHVPVVEMAAEYGAAHIFLPTHKESVGMAVLESAVSGAMPVVRYGYLKTDLLDTVPSLLYRDAVPWTKLLGMIDVSRTRAIARRNSWEAVAARVMEHLRDA